MELETAEDVEGVIPKVEKMQNFPGRGGVIITAPGPADSNLDFVSRFFCPKSGIIEVHVLKLPQSFWVKERRSKSFTQLSKLGSDTRCSNELLIDKVPQRGKLVLSLRDFAHNFIVTYSW